LLDNLRDKLEEGGEAAIAGWHWWTAELWAALPEVARAALNKPEPRLIVDLIGEDIVVQKATGAELIELARFRTDELGNDVASPAELGVHGATATIRLPASYALKRHIHLPIAGKRNLREILVHELDRQSPIDPTLVYFDYRVTARDKEAGRIGVELRLVKRDLTDRASDICRSLDLAPLDVEFLNDRGETDGTRFVIDRKTHTRRRMRSFVTPTLAAVAILLALSAAHAALSRNQTGLDRLSSEMRRLRSEAQIVDKLKRDVSEAKARLDFLGNAKRSPLLVRTLADVTHILPDKSWLFEFELNGNEVRIRGYSPAASKLVELFDNSQSFANAQFRSPIVQGSSKDLERFDLSFDLKEPRS